MSTFQYVWAHDGNVQSYHRRLMTSVDRENVAGFPVSFTTACALTPLSTFDSWNFLRHSGIFKRQAFEQYDDLGILPSRTQSGRMLALDGNFGIFPIIMEVTINLQTPCATNDQRLGFVLQCDSSPMNHLRRRLQLFAKRLDCRMWLWRRPMGF